MTMAASLAIRQRPQRLPLPHFAVLAFAALVCHPAKLAADDPAIRIEPRPMEKLLYMPGESAAAHVTLSNHGNKAREVRLQASLIHGLDSQTPLGSRTVTLPAGEEKTLDWQFTAGPDEFGYELRLAVHEAKTGASLAAGRDYFSVARNFFDVGIGGTRSPIMSDRPANLAQLVREARRDYANWFDVFFWAPCDWALHVSPLDRWWSGQTSYRHVERYLRQFIDDCHARGIRVASYASCNPAGPFGWEVARRQPEWFVDRSGRLPMLTPNNIEALEHWNDPQWCVVDGKPRPHPGWLRLSVDLRRLDALDHGIEQIIAGAKHYGWDAVRFDGHYTIRGYDEISTRNMRRLKERVWRELPDFRFGFNYGRAPAWQGGVTHEMREAMAGGGMYMQEGIRAWRYTGKQYESWKHYATGELQVAKQVQSLGGSYHCIWDLPREVRSNPAAALYKLVYGLIAGAHPAYGGYHEVAGCDNWGAWMTRWSGFLWDRRITAAEAEVDRVEIDSSRPLFWRPLVQQRVVSEKKKYVILHLVNPSPDDEIAKTSLPGSVRDVSVRYTPPADTKVRKTFLIHPDARADASELPARETAGKVQVAVPEIAVWGMVVLELEGSFALPGNRPRFTAPPDEAKVAAAMQATVSSRTFDPNQPPVVSDLGPNERIWETDSGFSGVAALTTADADATGGRAQVQTYAHTQEGHSQKFMGRTWLGPLTPGKYRLGYRVKWTDPSGERAWRGQMYITVIKEDRDVVLQTVASPNCLAEKSDRFEEFLGAGYRERVKPLGTADQYHYVPVEFTVNDTGYINACIITATDGPGRQRLYLDHIKTELLEPFDDQHQEKLHDLAKPENLRTPQGARPEKILLVRGLFADRYALTELLDCDQIYRLPEQHAALYAYDALVLVNVDVTLTEHKTRRVLRDFVADGGRLVILGGIATLGQGGMRHTYFEQMAPVAMTGNNELKEYATPQLLAPRRGEPYPDKPALFWRHDVEFSADARPITYAGTQPVAGRRAFGDGEVVVFTGTVLGGSESSGSDQSPRPFWQTPSWRTLLRQMATE